MRRYRTLALGAAALALVLSACQPGGSGGSPSASTAVVKPTVKVGSAGFWESAVVAEMYAQALEAKDYPVERHLQIGERPALHAAFTKGDVNLIPEYLGGLIGVAAATIMAIVVSRLGVLRLMLAVIAGQAAGGLGVDLVAPIRGEHVTAATVAGVALTFVAVVVTARGDQGPR